MLHRLCFDSNSSLRLDRRGQQLPDGMEDSFDIPIWNLKDFAFGIALFSWTRLVPKDTGLPLSRE